MCNFKKIMRKNMIQGQIDQIVTTFWHYKYFEVVSDDGTRWTAQVFADVSSYYFPFAKGAKKFREFVDQFSHFCNFIFGISSIDLSIGILISFWNLFWTACKPKYAINTFTIITSLSERTRPRWKKIFFIHLLHDDI